MRSYHISTWLLVGFSLAACSTSGITNRKVANDENARGLRYFPLQTAEIQVFRVFKEGENPKYQRVGDVVVTQIPDTEQLSEVNYVGAVFGTREFTVKMSERGGVKEISLTSVGSTGAGGVSAVRQLAESANEAETKRQQAKIDELNRELQLIKARKDLVDALKGN
jgi:hypothetical protein